MQAGAGAGQGGLPGVYIVHAAPFYPDRHDGRMPAGDATHRTSRSRINSLDVTVSKHSSRLASPSGACSPSAALADLDAFASFGEPVEVLPENSVIYPAAAEPVTKNGVAAAASRATAAEARTRVTLCIRAVLVPIVFTVALYGMVPMRLRRPLMPSAHPWRSTLLYVVAMQVLVSLSAHSVYKSYRNLLRSEAETAAGVDQRLLAAQSVLHVSSHFILVILWAEVPALRACLGHVHDFMQRHGHMVANATLRRITRVLPWITVFFSFVLAPTMVGVWCLYILQGETRIRHILSHLFQTVFVTNSFCLFAVCCMILRDLASCMAGQLAQELSTGHMTASRLEEFRLAWLSLRNLVSDMGVMPVTGLAMLAYILVMITLSAYQTVVSFSNGYAILFTSSLSLLTLCQGALIIICNAAHGLTDVMTAHFYEPLEARSWRGLSNGLLAEHQQFLHTISCSPAEVSFAGTVVIRRSTYLSMMAAITTYLIVLFQLRLSDEDSTAAQANSTDSPLSSS